MPAMRPNDEHSSTPARLSYDLATGAEEIGTAVGGFELGHQVTAAAQIALLAHFRNHDISLAEIATPEQIETLHKDNMNKFRAYAFDPNPP